MRFKLCFTWRVLIMAQKYINFKWCEEHGFTKVMQNVARDTSWAYEQNDWNIIVYTESTTGEKKLAVYNPNTKDFAGLECRKFYNDFYTNKLKERKITESDLKKLFKLAQMDYPFTKNE